jgi:hypothetical protein
VVVSLSAAVTEARSYDAVNIPRPDLGQSLVPVSSVNETVESLIVNLLVTVS